MFQLKQTPKLLGIELHHTKLCYTQAVIVKKQLQVEQVGQLALPHGLILDGYLRNPTQFGFLLCERFKDIYSVNLALPSDAIKKTYIQLSSYLTSKDLQSEIKNNLASYFHCQAEDLFFDYVILNRNSKNFNLLLFVAQKQLIHDYVNFFKKMGWHLKSIDSPLLALIRLMQNQNLGEEKIAVMAWEDSSGEFLILEKNKCIFYKKLMLNLQDSIQGISSFLNSGNGMQKKLKVFTFGDVDSTVKDLLSQKLPLDFSENQFLYNLDKESQVLEKPSFVSYGLILREILSPK